MASYESFPTCRCLEGQSLINTALREHIEIKNEPLEAILRRVLREELRDFG